MNSELYKDLVQYYFELQSKRKTYLEHINVLEVKYKAIDEQMARVNNILCKYGNHIYECFEEKQTVAKSNDTERDLIDCEHIKCENCVNHNYCEYEPYPAESEE